MSGSLCKSRGLDRDIKLRVAGAFGLVGNFCCTLEHFKGSFGLGLGGIERFLEDGYIDLLLRDCLFCAKDTVAVP
jgi:hypothetical protein